MPDETDSIWNHRFDTLTAQNERLEAALQRIATAEPDGLWAQRLARETLGIMPPSTPPQEGLRV